MSPGKVGPDNYPNLSERRRSWRFYSDQLRPKVCIWAISGPRGTGLAAFPPPSRRISHGTRRPATAYNSFPLIFGSDDGHRTPPSRRPPTCRQYTIVPSVEPVDGNAKTVANKSPSVTSRKSSANCTKTTGADQLIGGWSTASNFEKLFLSTFSTF